MEARGGEPKSSVWYRRGIRDGTVAGSSTPPDHDTPSWSCPEHDGHVGPVPVAKTRPNFISPRCKKVTVKIVAIIITMVLEEEGGHSNNLLGEVSIGSW